MCNKRIDIAADNKKIPPKKNPLAYLHVHYLFKECAPVTFLALCIEKLGSSLLSCIGFL